MASEKEIQAAVKAHIAYAEKIRMAKTVMYSDHDDMKAALEAAEKVREEK